MSQCHGAPSIWDWSSGPASRVRLPLAAQGARRPRLHRLVQPEGPAGPDGVPRRRLGPAATPAGPSVPRFSSTAYCRDWAPSWLTESRPDGLPQTSSCRPGPSSRPARRRAGKLANSCKVANKSLIQAKYFGVALFKITTVTTNKCKSKKGFERLFPIILIRIIGNS
jgi:hypothetical protein